MSNIMLQAGQCLFRHGDPGDCAYVIQSGRVRVTAQRPGRELLLGDLGPGAMLGELAVIDDGPRTATATAVEDTVLAIITRRQISDRLERADPMIAQLLRQTMAHLRREIEDEPIPPSPLLPGVARIRLEADLSAAVERDELALVYQPVVDLERRSIAGFEALLRWRHPVRGVVSPAEFIPLAEESGLIVQIGEWVLREACQAIASVAADGVASDYFITVNVSVRQLEADGFDVLLRDVLAATGLPPRRLRLEITEGLLIQSELARQTLFRCQEAQVALLLDDFGTGYSSLAYLNQLPFDGIKIDRSFAEKMTGGNDGRQLVAAMMGLAGSLGRMVVMEGIETAAQRDAFRSLGGRMAQGYLFGRPTPFSNIPATLRDVAGMPWGP